MGGGENGGVSKCFDHFPRQDTDLGDPLDLVPEELYADGLLTR